MNQSYLHKYQNIFLDPYIYPSDNAINDNWSITYNYYMHTLLNQSNLFMLELIAMNRINQFYAF